jgi:hypothetical protein
MISMNNKRGHITRSTDANHAEVVDALRKIGASVLDIHDLGHGAPDLIVGFRAQNLLLEIKDGRKPPSQKKLTDDEQKFFDAWRGPIYIVYSADDAIDVVTRMTADDDDGIPF